MIKEVLKRSGKFIIVVKNVITDKEKTFEINNMITDTALDEFVNILLGTSPDIEIEYLAVGDDNTANVGNETTLGNETFRTAVASKSNTDTGKVQSDFTILNTEAVGTIEEIGVFCGSGASAAADSGTLLSRILWNYTKTADEEISIRRIDELVRS